MSVENTPATDAPVELHRKKRVGIIVSAAMDKTVVVMVTKKVQHPVYKKFITRRVKYKAHAPNNRAQDPENQNEFRKDDKVEIEETRPLSRQKRWRVIRLIERLG